MAHVLRRAAVCLTIAMLLYGACAAAVRAQETVPGRLTIASVALQERDPEPRWRDDPYRVSPLSLEPVEPANPPEKWILGWPTFLDYLVELFNLADEEAAPGVGWALLPGVQLAVEVQSQETDGILPVPAPYTVNSWLHFHLREW